MTKCLIFIIFILIYSCNNDTSVKQVFDYPDIVKSKNNQEQYDSAVIAMYRLNSCCECNCLAVSNNSRKDTVNIIELELKLEAVHHYHDTTSFVFSYYKLDSLKNQVIYTPVGNGRWTECLFNGIAFKGSNTTAFPLSVGDLEISELDSSFLLQSKIQFEGCLKSNKLSKTLERYAKNQK
ncbi:MAG: hypothetical protein SFU99_14870 [Saprospiraceae bacterium]|nr:hypothetical protein [Saprospiraceae bacterium]